jgi:hypothetical protein
VVRQGVKKRREREKKSIPLGDLDEKMNGKSQGVTKGSAE